MSHTFDGQGWYLGPLPRQTCKASLIGKSNGIFKTAHSAAWPSQLCQWTAEAILTSFVQECNGGGEVSLKRKGQDAPLQEEKRQKAAPEKVAEKALVECMRPSVPGGEGPPRSCRWKGLEAPFHDGGGLASPGRWSPGMRKVLEGDAWRSVRHHLLLEAVRVLGSVSEVEKEAYRMAKGGDNFKLVREESILQRIRQVLAEKLDIAPQEATILFGPHERDLEKAGGPDWGFLEQAKTGLPLGVLRELPRHV